MKERPILFSGAMVRALLAGTKTQTRRVVKPQPPDITHQVSTWHHPDERPHFFAWTDNGEGQSELAEGGWCQPCPYGQPGDRLWVREAWRCHAVHDHVPGSELGGSKPAAVQHIADAAPQAAHPWGRMRHARFMPRWASRITLEITGVRVERLQVISEADARAEGVTVTEDPNYFGVEGSCIGFNARESYATLWDVINGPGACAANPWVWVVQFKRVPKEVAHAHA